MKLRYPLALLIGLATSWSAPAFADTLVLESDSWMPYSGDGKDETGYLIDIAKAVFEPRGIKVKPVVTPWVRAIKEARAGKCNGIVGAYVTDAPDFVFPSEEQGLVAMEFYVKKGSTWKFSGLPSLKKIKLGIVSDYSYSNELDEYIKANPAGVSAGYGDSPLQSNLKMLLSGRVDAVVDSEYVMKFTVGKMRLQDKVVSAGTVTNPLKTYIAFSPAHPKSAEYAKILSEGMVALRKSGELKKILARYDLADWK